MPVPLPILSSAPWAKVWETRWLVHKLMEDEPETDFMVCALLSAESKIVFSWAKGV